ncbi:MAG: PIG-L family deacetylase [Myxococcaceae bacterium]|nr:PIG-L family deacetylase [Myxococcaceae bacterium]
MRALVSELERPALPSAWQGLRLRLGLEGVRWPVDAAALAPIKRTTLVLAHTDDEINTCGLLSRLRAAGSALDLVVLTDGAANPWTDLRVVGDRTHFECRTEELRASMRLLDIGDAVLPGFPDGGLEKHLPAATALVQRHLEASRPDLVITFEPSGINGHPDHVAAHRVTRDALAAAGISAGLAMITPPPPFSYALGSRYRAGERPTIATLSLTPEERERKARLVEAYPSQAKTLKLLLGGLPPRTFFRLFPREWYLWLPAERALAWARAAELPGPP